MTRYGLRPWIVSALALLLVDEFLPVKSMAVTVNVLTVPGGK